MPDARKPGASARLAADNIMLILHTYSLAGSPNQVQAMIAAEVQRAIDEASGTFQPLPPPVEDPRQAPLLNCLTEIVAVLGYQPSIPAEHKCDMANALNELKQACGVPIPERRPATRPFNEGKAT